jgi:hypothetical protein
MEERAGERRPALTGFPLLARASQGEEAELDAALHWPENGRSRNFRRAITW